MIFLRRLLEYLGYRLVRIDDDSLPGEATSRDREIVLSAEPFTMTTRQRMWALICAVRYVVKANVVGDLVECGVWRGGNGVIMARVLLDLGLNDRDIWLYDTFEGMTTPTSDDVETRTGATAAELLAASVRNRERGVWCYAPIEEVRANLATTGYPTDRFRMVKGDVAHTLGSEVPRQIALLRLDTDWYESTKLELDVLYPRLVSGGVCIIDDYGYWSGARKAVDQYMERHGISVYMHCIDATSRCFLKP